MPYHSRYFKGGPQVTAGGLKEGDLAKNFVNNLINDTKQSMQDNLNTVSQKAGFSTKSGEGFGDLTRQLGHEIKTRTGELANSRLIDMSRKQAFSDNGNLSGRSSYDRQESVQDQQNRALSYAVPAQSVGRSAGYSMGEVPNRVEHKLDQARSYVQQPIRTAVSQTADYTRDKFDSAKQMSQPIAEGFKASGQQVANRTMQHIARADPVIYPIVQGVRATGQELKQAGREVKENAKEVGKDYLAMVKQIGQTVVNKTNAAAAKYGLDVSDAAVLLVASAVLSLMMLVITWQLIRQ